MAGISMGPQGPQDKEKASDLRRRYNWLNDLSDDELRDISFCQMENSELKDNEQYFDLNKPEQGIIQGRRHQTVSSGSCMVAKSQVKPQTWEKLIKPFSKQ
jgi:hypothetical protein